MFSGLSNQVTSWIGAAKGEPQDEEVPAPAASQVTDPAESAAAYSAQDQVPLDVDPTLTEGGEDGEKKQR